MKHYITKALMCLCMALLLFNCQKEEITPEQKTQTQKSSSNFSMLKSKEIEKDKNLMRILNDAEIKRQHSKANKTIYNEQYNFTINTDYAKVIANEEGLHSYTFGVYREEDNGLLENLLLKEQTDGTFLVYLVEYNLSETERNTLANKEIVEVDNKITYTPLEDISSSIFSKENSTSETCTVYSYEWEGGNTCNAGGNHSYEDGSSCTGWGTDLSATQSGWSLTSQEVDCGSGDSTNTETDNNNTNTNTNGNTNSNGAGNYTPNPDTTPILCPDCPEIEEEEDCPPIPEQLLSQLEAALGSVSVNMECDTPVEDAPFQSLEELQDFFDNFEETSTEGETTPLQLNTSKDDRYFKLQTLPALVKLKVVTKYEIPTDDEGMNLLSVTTSIIGNESISHWTSDDAPTEPTYSVNEANDLVWINVSGNLKTGLYVPVLNKVVGITKSYQIVLRYEHSTGEHVSSDLVSVN